MKFAKILYGVVVDPWIGFGTAGPFLESGRSFFSQVLFLSFFGWNISRKTEVVKAYVYTIVAAAIDYRKMFVYVYPFARPPLPGPTGPPRPGGGGGGSPGAVPPLTSVPPLTAFPVLTAVPPSTAAPRFADTCSRILQSSSPSSVSFPPAVSF
jgi:hypothetical protein